MISYGFYFQTVNFACRCDLVLRRLSGSKHLSLHARPQRQKHAGDCPSVHPSQRPHGPSRTFHPRRRLTNKTTQTGRVSPQTSDSSEALHGLE